MGYDPDADYIPELFGKCSDVSERMVEVFPELIITGDFAIVSKEDVDNVYLPGHDLYDLRYIYHTWVKTVTGETIDPTIKQFKSITGYKETD